MRLVLPLPISLLVLQSLLCWALHLYVFLLCNIAYAYFLLILFIEINIYAQKYCGIRNRKPRYSRIKIPNAARMKAVKNVSTFKMSSENNPIFKPNQHDGLAFKIYRSKYYPNSKL